MKALKILMFHFILLSVYLCCLPTSSHASDYSCGANATWHFEEGTLTISGTGEVSGQPWSELQDQIQQVIVEPGITNLPDHAFSHYGSLKNVTLPGSLAEIGSYAFAYCRNLTYIHLPEGLLAIGDWAFYSTGLTGITIPDGVTRIEALTFSACERLSRVTLSPHTTFIGNSAFHDCTKLSDIQLPDTLESLGHSAFSHCLSLTEIVLPDSLTVIPFDTFRYCENLSSVNLSPYTTYIGEGAFHDCHKLTSITLPPTVEYIAGFGSDLQQIHISDIAAWCETDFLSGEHNGLANAELYLNGELVTDLVVPEGCEGVWQFAFAGYQHLRSVTLPEGVAGIGWYAFSGCTNLTSVTLPGSIQTIGDGAFYQCPNLENVVYNGTRQQLSQVRAYSQNDDLLNATWQLGSLGLMEIYTSVFSTVSIVNLILHAAVVIACIVIYIRQKKYPYL